MTRGIRTVALATMAAVLVSAAAPAVADTDLGGYNLSARVATELAQRQAQVRAAARRQCALMKARPGLQAAPSQRLPLSPPVGPNSVRVDPDSCP